MKESGGVVVVGLCEKSYAAVRQLRSKLHSSAELSGQEHHTMQILEEFLCKYSSFKIVRAEGYLYAYQKTADNIPSIAFRADMDGILGEQGQARHGCGHDGHMAILCGLAMLLSDSPPTDKNIYLVFQAAEETGIGAKQIVDNGFIEQCSIQEIYGVHNIPAIDKHKVVSRAGIFACTSKGLTIKLVGKPSHAAYPEAGINPVYAFAELVRNLQQPVASNKGLVLCTVVHLQVGQKTFGTAASSGELSLTLRAEYEADLQELEQFICTTAKQYATSYGLECEYESCDEFPETANHLACIEKLEQACKALGLQYERMQQPMRWSEDFGYYTKCTKGAFFGIGAGLECPQLHTQGYEFPDEILKTGMEIFAQLAHSKI